MGKGASALAISNNTHRYSTFSKLPPFVLARIQQFLALLLVAASTMWLFLFWEYSVPLALTGFVCGLFSFSALLAIQCTLMATINPRGANTGATFNQWVYAWLTETVVALKVFFWWQPFRSNAIANQLPVSTHGQPQRGVVFLHGFACNRGVWTLWLRILQSRGIAFSAINLEPVFGSIDDYTSRVERAIREITQSTGKPPLLVCHSMGGLAARAWLRASGGDDRVHRVVTIGSPHAGTLVPHLNLWGSLFVNGSQMRSGSQWLAELALHEPRERAARFTCFYSNCDNIVPAAAATLAGADNRFVAGVPHVALVFDQDVIHQTLSML